MRSDMRRQRVEGRLDGRVEGEVGGRGAQALQKAAAQRIPREEAVEIAAGDTAGRIPRAFVPR